MKDLALGAFLGGLMGVFMIIFKEITILEWVIIGAIIFAIFGYAVVSINRDEDDWPEY